MALGDFQGGIGDPGASNPVLSNYGIQPAVDPTTGLIANGQVLPFDASGNPQDPFDPNAQRFGATQGTFDSTLQPIVDWVNSFSLPWWFWAGGALVVVLVVLHEINPALTLIGEAA